MGKFFWFTNPTLGNMKAIGEYHEPKGDNPACYWLITIPEWFTPEFKAMDFYEFAEGKCLLVQIPEVNLANDWIIGDPAPSYTREKSGVKNWELLPGNQEGRISEIIDHYTVKIDDKLVWSYYDIHQF